MIKHYLLFAKWRKKDVEFLNSFDLKRKVEEGYFGIPLEEGDTLNKIIKHYSKKDNLFNKTKPQEFSFSFQSVTFLKEELDNAKYYALLSLGGESHPNRWPLPNKEQEYQTEVFDCIRYESGKAFKIVKKRQKKPFKIKKPRWEKDKVCFNLGLEYEYTCFKKEFYQEVLAPLGLKSMEVLDYKTGKPIKDTVQLVIPTAKSKLLLENSAYDIHSLEETNGFKQYAVQTLDFFPPFEKEFDFHICYSQEDFYIGHKKIIISKGFCDLLVKHKIIRYDTWNLTPMKS